jgi:phosphatidylserine/phosphatidylglycerophosphate/cardiolipin synthase-like enzyme
MLPAELPDATSFGIDLDRRPDLDLKTFTGTHNVRAGVSPDCSYELLKATLDEATSELLIYIYNVSAPHVLECIADARDRGAAVWIMYDAKDTSGDEVNKLKALGVELKVAPSRDPRRVFDVCHQKFAVIDKKIVILGSANWAASSIPKRLPGKKRRAGNREWLLRIDNKDVAKWFRTLFEGDFAIEEVPSFEIDFEVEVREEAVPTPSFAPLLDTALQHFPALAGPVTPLVSPDNYFAHVKKLIDGATKRLYLQHQYIIGGASAPSVDKLVAAVKARHDAGVDVRIIVSSRFARNWERTKDTLEAHGLKKRLKAINLDNFIHCHNKGVIADDHVVVSSTNWSENSIRRAREAGVAVHSKDLAQYFATVFEDDWDNGWTVAEGDAGPSFDIEAGVDVELASVHPSDQE